MTVRQLALAPALAFVLAVPVDLAFAQRSGGRGGGGAGYRGGSGFAAARGSSTGARGPSTGARASASRMSSGVSARSHASARVVSGPRGGGYAVARGPSMGGRSSAPRAWSGGPVAPYRHPRAGTGTGSYYGRAGGRYGYGSHGRGYPHGYRGGYPYYRGYYPYRSYYYPYYRPSYYSSFYWGWPYSYAYAPYYAWPFYAAAPFVAGAYYGAATSDTGAYDADGSRASDSYSAGADVPRYERPPQDSPDRDAQEAEPAPRSGRRPPISILGESGQLRLEVRPDDASIYVDDEFRGTAREARQLTLAPGRHGIEIVRPGYATERHMVEIVKGERADLLVELRRP